MRTLTLDDVLEFSERTGDPHTAAAELLGAVEQGQLADPSDAAPAFVIAGRLLADDGDLTTALTLADKGVKASKAHDVEEWGPRAFRADVLLRLERTSEGMAELEELRSYLTDDRYSAGVVSGVLERHGQGELAVEWLTEALADVLQRNPLSASRSDEDAALGMCLMEERYRLRRRLELPVDEFDQAFEELTKAFVDYLSGPAESDELWYSDVLFGQQDYERLVTHWPAFAEEHGETWDQYRGYLERSMALAYREGVSKVELVPVPFDDLLAFAGPELTVEKLHEFADSVADSTAVIMWPPGRNDACWCGSGTKYKKCCLPRSRS